MKRLLCKRKVYLPIIYFSVSTLLYHVIKAAIFRWNIPEHIHLLSRSEPYLSRILRIQERCSGMDQSKHTVLTTRLKYDDQLNFILCETPKVASTTWQTLLLKLGNFPQEITDDMTHNWMYDGFPNKNFNQLNNTDEAWRRIKSFTSVHLIRHPFERLVSAYIDKLTNRSNLRTYRERVGVRIALQQVQGHVHGLKFARYLGSLSENHLKKFVEFRRLGPEKQRDILEYSRIMKSGEVTFNQFVKFLKKEHEEGNVDKMDAHWRPQMLLCTPCLFNYSYVIKFENLVEESNRLLDYLQPLNFKSLFKAKIVFPNNKRSFVDKEQTRKTFKEISEKDVETLRKIYAEDFQTFQYDPYLYRGHD